MLPLTGGAGAGCLFTLLLICDIMTPILLRSLLALEVEVPKNSAILLFLMALAILVPLVTRAGMSGR